MLQVLSYCVHRKLGWHLLTLVLISTLAAGSGIWFAEYLASWVHAMKSGAFDPAKTTPIVLVAGLFLASSLFNLSSEYVSQTLSTRIAAHLGRDYLEAFMIKKISSESINDAKGDITAVLLNQMERFRQEYLMSATSIITRVVIIGTAFLYFLFFYPIYTIGIAVSGLLFIVTSQFLLRSMAGITDRYLTQANQELGTVTSRAARTVLLMALIGNTSELARNYEKAYHRLGIGRGIGSITSLLPRSLVELFGVAAVIITSIYAGGLSINSEYLVYVGMLFLRFNPHFQFLLKNLAVMQTAEGVRDIIKINSIRHQRRPISLTTPLPASICIRDNVWQPKVKRWLRINGPSGSGKTTLLLEIAQMLHQSGVQICVIQNNDDIPLLPLTGEGLTWEALRGDLHLLGLSDVIERLDKTADRQIEGLSNGERQRILIAMAIHAGAQVLILDEGLSALDDISLANTMDFIQNRSTAAVLFCCHGRRSFCQEKLGEGLLEWTAATAASKAVLSDGDVERSVSV